MTTSLRQSAKSAPAILVGVVALFAGSLLGLFELIDMDWDATFFTAFGEQAVEIREYAEERLGEVILRPALGHDGRFFFVQGNDPWVLEPSENAMILDRPLYRSQRMLYPLIASGFGTLGSEQIVWGLLIVNIIGLGLGSWAVASIATQMGMSPWWGLAFLLNIGFVSEFNISGAGILAGAAAFGAVALILREKFVWSIALVTAAALSREVMLVVALGAAWWLWRKGRHRIALTLAFVPLGAVALWAAYLRFGVGLGAGGSEVDEIGLPLVGFVSAFSSWLEDPLDLIVGLAMMAILVLFTIRVIKQDQLVGWAFVGFVPVAILLTEQVWHSYFDITRAIAPVLTAYVLLLGYGEYSKRSEPGGGANHYEPLEVRSGQDQAGD